MLWWAVLPAAISVLIVTSAVREPRAASAERRPWPVRRTDLARLGRDLWVVVAIGVLFTMARFSEAFLLLMGPSSGLALGLVPLVLVCMNVVYAAASTPAGSYSDRFGRRRVLKAGMALLVIADLVLAAMPGIAGLCLGAALWGLHMATSQGLLAALVADTAPADPRGTAFGAFNLVTRVAILLASALAGALWQASGPAATFTAGAAFAAMALAALRFGHPATIGQPRS